MIIIEHGGRKPLFTANRIKMGEIKEKPTRVRLNAEKKMALQALSEKMHISQSALIGMAIERCLADNRWSADSNAHGASKREMELFTAFTGLCQVVNNLAFSVDDALQSSNRNRRKEAKLMVDDVYVELGRIRKTLNVS